MIRIDPAQFLDPRWRLSNLPLSLIARGTLRAVPPKLRLRHFRKEWDDEHSVWKDRPRHNDNSHGADAFLTFACSDWEPPRPFVYAKRDLSWVI
jgi:hypothetical protein